MGIRLTERDIQLLTWIHQVGFVTIEHITQWLAINSSTTYKRVKKLVDYDYLIQERITYEGSVYYLSRRGVDISRSVLPVLRKISLATYHHDLRVATVYLQLVKQLGGSIVTERELRHQQGAEAFGTTTHLSDGDFLIHGKRVAIEVELNKKSQYRRDKIFHHYLKHVEYDGVWYFCGNHEVRRHMESYTQQVDWLRLLDLDTFIHNPESIHALSHKIR